MEVVNKKSSLDFQGESLDVIIIGLNEEENLLRCIRSAQLACEQVENTLNVKTRIIYVDSYSTDQSRGVARDLSVEVFFPHPDFQGSSNGRASGIVLTNGTYINFLDGDCELHKNWLVGGLSFLRGDNNTGGVFGTTNLKRYVGERVIEINNVGGHISEIISPTPNSYLTGNLLIKRAALEEIGGHEPDMVRSGDVYFVCELLARKWQIYKIPIPMCNHWDIFFQNHRMALTKFRIMSAGSQRRGTLLHYARARGTLRHFLPHLKWEFIHGIFLLLLTLIMILFVSIPGYHLVSGVLALVLCIGYLFAQCIRKRSVVFGLTSIPLLTMCVFGVLIGLIFKYPKMRWGAQRTEQYRNTVQTINTK